VEIVNTSAIIPQTLNSSLYASAFHISGSYYRHLLSAAILAQLYLVGQEEGNLDLIGSVA